MKNKLKFSFADRIRILLKAIPEGQVATYGQIAKLAGNPRGTRAVVWLLASSSASHGLPWHRVINSKGIISTRSELQVARLSDEGVKVRDFSVDLKKYLWSPASALIDSLFEE